MRTATRQPENEPAYPDEADGVMARHIGALADQAEQGAFDPASVDAILTLLVAELRNVCGTGRHLQDRLAEASRALADLEGYADDVRRRRTGSPLPPPGQLTLAEIIRRHGERQAARHHPGPIAPPAAPFEQPQPVSALAETRRVFIPPATPIAPAADGPLDGPALARSILPTWLALVGLSWVSLIWGGLISAPFGVGAAILGGGIAGMVMVPLWATVFGLLGMGRAKDATLKEMGFEPCEASHPLALRAAEFSQRLGMPAPQVGTVGIFNAFAMGSAPTRATVAMGVPLLQTLTEAETEAVLAHELGHVVSGDMRRMMLMRTFQNATVWFMVAQGAKRFARWVICWGAELYILAFSRKREFWADAVAAALTSKEAMIGALERLQDGPELTAPESTHARFMVRGRMTGMFSTHPPVEARIAALEAETYLRQLPRLGG